MQMMGKKPMEPNTVGSMNYSDANNGFLFRTLKWQLIQKIPYKNTGHNVRDILHIYEVYYKILTNLSY